MTHDFRFFKNVVTADIKELRASIATITAGGSGGPTISGGTVSRNTGTVNFSNSNGVTFGLNTNGVMTASHNGLTSQLSQAFSAEGGSSSFQTLSFSNANGISFSNNAGQVQASYTVPTVTNSTISLSDAASSGTLARLAFTNLNGVTLSLSTGANGSHTVVGSHNALTSQSNQALSAANGSFTFQTAAFADSNGVSFATGTQGIFATVKTDYLTTARASNDAVGLNTAQSNVTWTANSNGLSLDARGYAGTGTSATNASITMNSNGLAISVAAPGGGAINVTAGTTSGNLQTIQFGDANGVSFGLNGSTVTASHNALTSQSNQAFSADASSTFQTLSFQDSNGISFSNNAGAIRLTHGLQFTSNTSAITSNALNTSASRVINIVAATDNTGGGTASLSSNVSFSNANGLTFYTSAGNAVVGSYTVPTVTNSAMTISDAGTSGTLARLAFTNLNGMTLSLSTGANGSHTVVGSYTVPTVTNSSWSVSDNASSGTVARLAFTNLNGVTLSLSTGAGGSHTIVGSHNALTSQSNQALSAANGSFTFQTATFANSNGVSFSTGTQGIYATVATNYLTTARASNDAVGLNTALTAGPLAWTVNSSGLSLNAGSAAGTSSGFSGNLIGGSMTHNTAGLALSLSHPAWLTTARGSTDAVGLNTAQTNVTWTVNSSGLSLNAAGYAGTGTSATNASITLNSNGLAISVAAPGAGGGFAAQGSGAYTQNTGTIQFANSNGITFGLSTNQMTASHNGLTTAAQSNHSHGNPTLNLTNLSGTTASASNGFTLSLSAAAPGGGADKTASFHEINDGIQSTAALWNNATFSNRPIFIPFKMQEAITAVSSICIFASRTGGTSAAATLFAGIYTIANSTSMNLVSSTSFNISVTTSAQFSGIRQLCFTGLGGFSMSAGQYVLGLMASMPSTASWGMNAIGNNSLALAGHLLAGTNSTAATASASRLLPFHGVFNATSAGLPSAVGTVSISGGNGANSPKIYAAIKAIP